MILIGISDGQSAVGYGMVCWKIWTWFRILKFSDLSKFFDQVILAMVSCGLGISIMEELMLEQNEYPVVACSFAKPFYRNIGICVKDKRAISRSTYRFVEHVRRWVLEKYSG